MALTFTDLLRLEGLDPKQVRLVRHQDEGSNGMTPWALWLCHDGRFETYQRIQGRNVFDGCSYLASFVALPDRRTLFVGMYDVNGKALAPAGLTSPLTGKDVAGLNFYELLPSGVLADYAERIVIDWGEGFRAWVQWAHKQSKPVIEIRADKSDPPFPGFLSFERRLSELASLPLSWREALMATKGVYLLRGATNGALYVGSATGAEGFLGRWRDYAANGHGGNVMMLDHGETDYSVSILETVSSSASAEEVLQSEEKWKRKLGSRAFGLNGN